MAVPELHLAPHRAEAASAAAMEAAVTAFAAANECELLPAADGFVLLPEVMQRKHGVFVFPLAGGGVKVCREEDATTWEDYLMVKLAHELAAEWGGELRLDGEGEPFDVSPASFATFDHYVETVLAFDDDLVKQMKRTWIYAHRKRFIR